MELFTITYNKANGEYRIKHRHPITGEMTVTFSNHLTEAEKEWASKNSYYQDPFIIQWVRKSTRTDA